MSPFQPTAENIRRRDEWIAKYGFRPEVQRWIKQNPPPPSWQESPEAWAFTEMPIGVLFSPRSALEKL